MSLQRSEQNGRHFDAGVHSTLLPQLGQLTIRGVVMAVGRGLVEPEG